MLQCQTEKVGFWAHLWLCTVGSYESLSVCLSVCLSVRLSVTRQKLLDNNSYLEVKGLSGQGQQPHGSRSKVTVANKGRWAHINVKLLHLGPAGNIWCLDAFLYQDNSQKTFIPFIHLFIHSSNVSLVEVYRYSWFSSRKKLISISPELQPIQTVMHVSSHKCISWTAKKFEDNWAQLSPPIMGHNL